MRYILAETLMWPLNMTHKLIFRAEMLGIVKLWLIAMKN
jgi:hypothetical protein